MRPLAVSTELHPPPSRVLEIASASDAGRRTRTLDALADKVLRLFNLDLEAPTPARAHTRAEV
eukprot:1454482-Rhodomonas_salina.1